MTVSQLVPVQANGHPCGPEGNHTIPTGHGWEMPDGETYCDDCVPDRDIEPFISDDLDLSLPEEPNF